MIIPPYPLTSLLNLFRWGSNSTNAIRYRSSLRRLKPTAHWFCDMTYNCSLSAGKKLRYSSIRVAKLSTIDKISQFCPCTLGIYVRVKIDEWHVCVRSALVCTRFKGQNRTTLSWISWNRVPGSCKQPLIKIHFYFFITINSEYDVLV